MKIIITLLHLFIAIYSTSQTYTTYFTGNTEDLITTPSGGICLMGGASEDDEAMKWFLKRANGGDVLVLRTSGGSNGYNEYMYSDLGVTLNSVETIVFNSPEAVNEPYIHNKLNQAEAIWFAGGDQWDYINYWRNTSVDSLINRGIETRNIVVRGTSAGMAILGKFYFSAQNGTVTSVTALSNPYAVNVTIDSASFIQNNILSDVITDTHYDNPDRKGRHITFLARIFKDYNIPAKGIACDEYTAVCINNDGIASVYGTYPAYDDNAYFIQPNCELSNMLPEICEANTPLTWNLNSLALRVYKVKGTTNGTNTFNLNDRQTGNGGTWQNWYALNGTKYVSAGNQIDCYSNSNQNAVENIIGIINPNPCSNILFVNIQAIDYSIIVNDLN